MYPSKANAYSHAPPQATGLPSVNQYYLPPPPPTLPPSFILSPANQYYTPPPLPSGGPATFNVQSQATVDWSTGLCDCCDDKSNCCVTCCCPCITFGQIAEIADRGSSACGTSGALYVLICLVTGCQCLYSCFYRTKMRRQYSLSKSPCGDCLVHCFCEHCALCQEYRELKRRGFNMSIGWQANMERQGRGDATTAPPPVQREMRR